MGGTGEWKDVECFVLLSSLYSMGTVLLLSTKYNCFPEMTPYYMMLISLTKQITGQSASPQPRTELPPETFPWL